MKAKHLSLKIAALLAVGGLWLAWSSRHEHAAQKSSSDTGFKESQVSNSNSNSATSLDAASQAGPDPGRNSLLKPDHTLRPPDPNRRFMDFTPEQRVQFARQGHGPGG